MRPLKSKDKKKVQAPYEPARLLLLSRFTLRIYQLVATRVSVVEKSSLHRTAGRYGGEGEAGDIAYQQLFRRYQTLPTSSYFEALIADGLLERRVSPLIFSCLLASQLAARVVGASLLVQNRVDQQLARFIRQLEVAIPVASKCSTSRLLLVVSS